MDIDLIAVFMIGLLGGFSHCTGMCSGFVMTYTVKIAEKESTLSRTNWHKLKPHLLYNSGRILTYTILGEIFGFLGGTIGFIMSIRDFQGGLQLIAGLFMFVIGMELAGFLPVKNRDYFPGFNLFKKVTKNLFDKIDTKNVFGLGFVLGFIPCGLVYAAGAYAAATESIVHGMITMFIFGLGTLPAMMIMGLAAHSISYKSRRKFYKIASVIIIIMAIITLLRGVDALGWYKIYWLDF